LLRDLPPGGRWYILGIIGLGMLLLGAFLPRAPLTPILPLLLLVLLSSLTAAFKVQLPIAGGSTMSVSYIVDILSLLLRGPHATMIVAAASGWSQSTFNVHSRNRPPLYRIAFNIAVLIITVQAAGRVYQRLGGDPLGEAGGQIVPLTAMAVSYFFLNTLQIAIAVALTTHQSVWRIWKTDFASSAPNYLIGAAAAAVVVAVTASAGYGLTLLFAAAPLYLTYRLYRAGKETEARQGAILEAAQDAIVTIDHQLNIREFNRAAERVFGRSRLDTLGRGVDILLPANELALHLPALKEYLATGEGPLARNGLELTACRADGTEFPVELTASRMGSTMTAFIRDVTERRALEEQLRQSQKLEAIGRLAGGVAHDFNNILMSILGSADLLLMSLGREDGSRDEAIEIKNAVERGAGVTRQLLAFGRRQATRARLVALGDVVRGMETMLRRLIGPEIEFEIQASKPVTVFADSGQIEQVVMNFVINARDAMPDGGRLTVRVDDVTVDGASAVTLVEGHPGRYARLSVTDTGTGMSEQTRAKLFEPFFTTKEQGKGTGLGLSIVYGIVKQSGGYIRVTSEPGRGTTFVVYLPVASAAEPAVV
jgi:PAS domain S-box-containing protein